MAVNTESWSTAGALGLMVSVGAVLCLCGALGGIYMFIWVLGYLASGAIGLLTEAGFGLGKRHGDFFKLCELRPGYA